MKSNKTHTQLALHLSVHQHQCDDHENADEETKHQQRHFISFYNILLDSMPSYQNIKWRYIADEEEEEET